MNKRAGLARIIAYILVIAIVFAIIASHGTLTGMRILVAIAGVIAGALILRGLDKLADKDVSAHGLKKISLKGVTLDTILAYAGITALAVIIRIAFWDYISPDVAIFQENWYAELHGQGLFALSMKTGDYPPLYMTVFSLLVQLPDSMLLSTKLIPIIFDFVLAVGGLFLFKEVFEDTSVFSKLLVYSLLLLNPLSIINASAWGQCDSIYTSFVFWGLFVLVKLYREKDTNADMAFILFGCALACKLQTVLFLPAVLFLWAVQKTKKIRISQFIWLPVVYFVVCIPMLLSHRTIGELFGAYFSQVNQYSEFLNMKYPNFFNIIGYADSGMAPGASIYGTLLAIGVLLLTYLYLYKKDTSVTAELIVRISILTVLTMTFFMPSMHERYAYVAEMLMLLVVVKQKKYIVPTVLTIVCTAFGYIEFLLYAYEPVLPPAWLIAIVRLGVLVFVYKDVIKETTLKENTDND